MKEKTVWLRPLGDTEACLWHADHACRINFVAILSLRGPLSAPMIRDGLGHIQARHPLFRVAVATRRAWPWFTACERPIALRSLERPHDVWEDVVQDEINTALDTEKGPCVRCVWISHGAERHRMLLTFHHAIGDGISGAYVVRDFLRVLGEVRSEETALALRPSFAQTFPKHVRGLRRWVGYASGIGSMLAWLARGGLVRGVRSDRRGTKAHTRKACVVGRTLSRDRMERLAERAREEHTTVHGALGAALLCAISEDYADRKEVPLLLASPVNLRDRLDPPAQEDVGFFVSMGVSMHSVQTRVEDVDFWELARDVRGMLMEFVAADRPWTVLPVQNTLMSPWIRLLSPARFAQMVYASQLPGIGLTNIGRVRLEERYGELDVESLSFAASLGPLGDFAATAATFRGELAWMFIGMEPVVSRERVEQLATRCVELVMSSLDEQTGALSGAG